MATGPRIVLTPAPFNTASAVSVFPLYATVGAAGVDAVGAGGVNFATAWSTALGVIIPNQGNGAVWLYYTCGAVTPSYQVLIGNVAGSSGQVPPATAEAGTLVTSSSGWLGPWSPLDVQPGIPDHRDVHRGDQHDRADRPPRRTAWSSTSPLPLSFASAPTRTLW